MNGSKKIDKLVEPINKEIDRVGDNTELKLIQDALKDYRRFLTIDFPTAEQLMLQQLETLYNLGLATPEERNTILKYKQAKDKGVATKFGKMLNKIGKMLTDLLPQKSLADPHNMKARLYIIREMMIINNEFGITDPSTSTPEKTAKLPLIDWSPTTTRASEDSSNDSHNESRDDSSNDSHNESRDDSSNDSHPAAQRSKEDTPPKLEK